jgi:hypothetical protein
MKKVKLTDGQIAKVDDEDYAYVMQWKWDAVQIDKMTYAARTDPASGELIVMHDVIYARAQNSRN